MRSRGGRRRFTVEVSVVVFARPSSSLMSAAIRVAPQPSAPSAATTTTSAARRRRTTRARGGRRGRPGITPGGSTTRGRWRGCAQPAVLRCGRRLVQLGEARREPLVEQLDGDAEPAAEAVDEPARRFRLLALAPPSVIGSPTTTRSGRSSSTSSAMRSRPRRLSARSTTVSGRATIPDGSRPRRPCAHVRSPARAPSCTTAGARHAPSRSRSVCSAVASASPSFSGSRPPAQAIVGRPPPPPPTAAAAGRRQTRRAGPPRSRRSSPPGARARPPASRARQLRAPVPFTGRTTPAARRRRAPRSRPPAGSRRSPPSARASRRQRRPPVP